MARITSIEELCEAQTETRSFDCGYWTALKLNSMGMYQWGLLANNSANISAELLDKTQPVGRCYVISKSAMKLLSKDCNSLQGVLVSQTYDEEGKQIIRPSHQERIHHIGAGKPGQKTYAQDLQDNLSCW